MPEKLPPSLPSPPPPQQQQQCKNQHLQQLNKKLAGFFNSFKWRSKSREREQQQHKQQNQQRHLNDSETPTTNQIKHNNNIPKVSLPSDSTTAFNGNNNDKMNCNFKKKLIHHTQRRLTKPTKTQIFSKISKNSSPQRKIIRNHHNHHIASHRHSRPQQPPTTNQLNDENMKKFWKNFHSSNKHKNFSKTNKSADFNLINSTGKKDFYDDTGDVNAFNLISGVCGSDFSDPNLSQLMNSSLIDSLQWKDDEIFGKNYCKNSKNFENKKNCRRKDAKKYKNNDSMKRFLTNNRSYNQVTSIFAPNTLKNALTKSKLSDTSTKLTLPQKSTKNRKLTKRKPNINQEKPNLDGRIPTENKTVPTIDDTKPTRDTEITNKPNIHDRIEKLEQAYEEQKLKYENDFKPNISNPNHNRLKSLHLSSLLPLNSLPLSHHLHHQLHRHHQDQTKSKPPSHKAATNNTPNSRFKIVSKKIFDNDYHHNSNSSHNRNYNDGYYYCYYSKNNDQINGGHFKYAENRRANLEDDDVANNGWPSSCGDVCGARNEQQQQQQHQQQQHQQQQLLAEFNECLEWLSEDYRKKIQQ
ncbi:hypothetical protein HELRODRAFT_172111 [Helobdella robusta]|uniref:Uncharacterized protein n=1 Tax=Helobdella robusta TaxID=6412 RepID=T1F516_HELRO|nr:hypothetical protein HELRODRAFT_172111 [Helobdella robusta]ESO05093.1 hypothetical protein HELRODRAFT_172111 [Helobdella robusta]